MFGIGMPELIIILVIILIIFGVGKLPEIGGGMGKAIRNFKVPPRKRKMRRRKNWKRIKKRKRLFFKELEYHSSRPGGRSITLRAGFF